MIGQALSHYRITAALGAGGMGEVYRATDTTLGRDVAIKVLPLEVAHDPERLARFEREAKLLASLNHPNIAAIYGLEHADSKPFLALELVEGEDLKQRLTRGAILVDEALETARHIAEGLSSRAPHGTGRRLRRRAVWHGLGTSSRATRRDQTVSPEASSPWARDNRSPRRRAAGRSGSRK